MNAANRVKRLMDAGTVSAEEGARLLSTLTPARPATSVWDLMMNPFDRFGGGVAALVGVAVSAACVFEARFGVHFDGALDAHLARPRPQSLAHALGEQALVWALPSLLFWVYARAATRHVRLLDFVGFVGLARAALVVVGGLLLAIAPDMPRDRLPEVTPALIALTVLALPFVAWFLVLLFQGFKNASGLQDKKLSVGFVGVLLVAEILSKLALRPLAAL